jgi:lipoic acid synthetase
MILGDVCTRRCGFCNVQTGKPTWNDPLEPLRVANQVKRMGLRHAVVTSVDRDDLPDYGASAFVGVIRSIRRMAPGCKVEVLTPDFRGEEMPLARVIAERPDVFNHNVETVPRLYPKARRGSDFLRSCRVLANAKQMDPDVVTKSGLMVSSARPWMRCKGHGRASTRAGAHRRQYLRPSENHLPLVRYWTPGEFAALEREAYAMGFESVASGPLVRSSYHADEQVPVRRASAQSGRQPPPCRGGDDRRLDVVVAGIEREGAGRRWYCSRRPGAPLSMPPRRGPSCSADAARPAATNATCTAPGPASIQNDGCRSRSRSEPAHFITPQSGRARL